MPFPYGAHELQGVDAFLLSKLVGNASLMALLAVQPPLSGGPAPPSIYSGLAPESAVPPFIVFDLLSSPDRNVIGNDARAFTRPLYVVRAYTTGTSYSQGEAIAALIDSALLGARGSVPAQNLSIMGVFREEPVRMTEVLEGVRWAYIGGRYRLFVTALN